MCLLGKTPLRVVQLTGHEQTAGGSPQMCFWLSVHACAHAHMDAALPTLDRQFKTDKARWPTLRLCGYPGRWSIAAVRRVPHAAGHTRQAGCNGRQGQAECGRGIKAKRGGQVLGVHHRR